MCKCEFYKFKYNVKFPAIRCGKGNELRDNQFVFTKGRDNYYKDICCNDKNKCFIYRELINDEEVK